MKYLTKEQVRKSLTEAAGVKDRYYLILLTLSESGLRASEFVALTPQNISFEGNYLHIVGKGNKIRNVDISQSLSMQLKLYINEKKIKNKERIFPFTRQRAHQIAKRFTGHKTHALRHTYAIHLLRKTKNIKYVQKQLGHSSLATTERYLEFVEYDQEKEALNSLYN